MPLAVFFLLRVAQPDMHIVKYAGLYAAGWVIFHLGLRKLVPNHKSAASLSSLAFAFTAAAWGLRRILFSVGASASQPAYAAPLSLHVRPRGIGEQTGARCPSRLDLDSGPTWSS